MDFMVQRNMRFTWKEKIYFFSIVARGIWFAFCFRVNTFTSKISNLLLPIGAIGARRHECGCKRIKIIWEMFDFSFLCWSKVCGGCFRQVFFSLGGQKRWLLATLDRWLSYIRVIVWELGWADSALGVLDEWASYRGGCLSRFECIFSVVFIKKMNLLRIY